MRLMRVYRRSIPDDHLPGQPPEDPQVEVVVFSDGTCVSRWVGAHAGTEVFSSFADFDYIHGHPEYDSEYRWFDACESGDQTPQPEGRI